MSLAGRILVVASSFAAAGALSTLPFVLLSETPSSQARDLMPPSAMAAAVVGVLAWWALVEHTTLRWRAPIAGALAGGFAHPLMWAIFGLTVGTGADRTLDELVAGSIVSSLFFSVFSLIAYGPLTVSLGALTGWALERALLRGRLRER